MTNGRKSIHVSLVATPDAMLSTLISIYDVLNFFALLGTFADVVPDHNPFQAEIVAPTHAHTRTASGLPVTAHRTVDELHHTDIIIIPSLMPEGGEWKIGRYPKVVNWLSKMHAQGAILCSACSGVLLLAETGLLDGGEATIHWAYSMSGASASWHDLVLYLVARHVGPTAAQGIAKFMLLQWHVDGQAPYVVFETPIDHGDAAVLDAQEWLADHFTVATPVEEMVRRSGLAERSFKRRFKKATGYSPITYVQHLRVEEAKRRLERTDAPIDEITWNVGYEDPAFFRRLFKRITRITPGAYRRKFQLPDFASAGSLDQIVR